MDRWCGLRVHRCSTMDQTTWHWTSPSVGGGVGDDGRGAQVRACGGWREVGRKVQRWCGLCVHQCSPNPSDCIGLLAPLPASAPYLLGAGCTGQVRCARLLRGSHPCAKAPLTAPSLPPLCGNACQQALIVFGPLNGPLPFNLSHQPPLASTAQPTLPRPPPISSQPLLQTSTAQPALPRPPPTSAGSKRARHEEAADRKAKHRAGPGGARSPGAAAAGDGGDS